LKRFIKSAIIMLGFPENSTLLKFAREIYSKWRLKAVWSKVGDSIGLFVAEMVKEEELKSYWKLVEPHSNGHDLIRVGGQRDGGYLLPNDLDGIKYCFSPGAGAIWSFEEALGSEHGIQSLVCDGTIERFPSFTSLKSFIPKNVGISESEKVISFYSWVESAGENPGDLLLQMDIEGGEYPILSSVDAAFLKKFRIIVLEIHDLNLLALPSSFSYQYSQLMSRILENFDLVHLHPNNCGGSYIAHGILLPKVIEVTFHRKDRARERMDVKIPHKLDSPNDEGLGEFPDFGFFDWLKS